MMSILGHPAGRLDVGSLRIDHSEPSYDSAVRRQRLNTLGEFEKVAFEDLPEWRRRNDQSYKSERMLF